MFKSNYIIDNRFALEELLGQGGMGKVYKAIDLDTGKRVAIKLLNKQKSIFHERFLREIFFLKTISHKHILPVHHVGDFSCEIPYFTMPLLHGKTLKEHFNTKPFPYLTALRIALDILDGLNAVHKKNIVHRDLKPSNIFLSLTEIPHQFQVKILDFGISKLLDTSIYSDSNRSITNTDMFIGTNYYMAPEQYLSPSDTDVRADIYSIGLVFYQLFSGVSPFGEAYDTGDDASYSFFDEDLDTVSGNRYSKEITQFKNPYLHNPLIPRRLGDVILKALNADPFDRFHSIDEFIFAINDAHQNPTKEVMQTNSEKQTAKVFPRAFPCSSIQNFFNTSTK